MRKTPYIVAFFVIVLTLIFNIISIRRSDWLVVTSHSDVLHTTVTTSYGLNKVCELVLTRIPGPDGRGKIKYEDYQCRPFPSRTKDGCEEDNEGFCATWTGAGYVEYLAVGFSGIAPLAFLFGMSTHSRRRRIWKALAGLTMLQSLTGIVAFGLITDMYQRDGFPGFEHAKPGKAYVLNVVSWVLSFLVTIGIAVAGVAAEKGQVWAAGINGYHPIHD